VSGEKAMRIRYSRTLGAGAALVALVSGVMAPATSSASDDISGVAAAGITLSVPGQNGSAPFNVATIVTVPRGWQAEVWARVPGARFEAWSPQGQLLVSDPGDGEVFELVPRANRALPPLQRLVLSGLTEPQGLAFDNISGQEVLYVAESNEVDRYNWGGGGVSARRVIVPNLPDQDPSGDDEHRAKTLTVGRDHIVYVNVGSSSNVDTVDLSWHPPRASILSFRPDGSDLRVMATGVRNAEGLAVAPDGTLWAAVNERDDISYPFHRAFGGYADAFNTWIQSYVNNNPPDELARITPGRNLGWPYCDPDAQVPLGGAGSNFDYADMPFVPDAQTNPSGQVFNCNKLARVDRGLPAHSAPLGMTFLEGSKLSAPWNAGAVVAVHGSSDRDPPLAPALLWLPWSPATHLLGAPVTLMSGFQLTNGSRWGRPVDAVPGPDGALYVTDDTANAVYRLVPQ
jgi:glucose/arabinose dehydrogenase